LDAKKSFIIKLIFEEVFFKGEKAIGAAKAAAP
jgi:hypothetical protein